MALKYKSGDLDRALQVVEEEGYGGLTDGEKGAIAGQLMVASAIRELLEKMDDLETHLLMISGAIGDLER